MSAPSKVYELPKGSELRLVVKTGEIGRLCLKKGKAEAFGPELVIDRVYSFTGTHIAIFTWEGCTLEVNGSADAYVAEETPMNCYCEIHAQLEARREICLVKEQAGPKVLIVGPTDCGKSTLSRILCGYALRRHRRPLFVDLDVGQGMVTIPGCVACADVDSADFTVEEGFCPKSPLMYFFGDSSPGASKDRFMHCIGKLSESIERRMEADPHVRASGMIVNTCGWIEGLGYTLILDIIKCFGIDSVLVLGQDRLFNDLRRDVGQGKSKSFEPSVASIGPIACKQAEVCVEKVPRSGGVVQRSGAARRELRDRRIHHYFYGAVLPGSPPDLSPCINVVNFADVVVAKFVEQIEEGLLPVTSSADVCPVTFELVAPSRQLQHFVLGVSHATCKENLGKANVAGFVTVTEVDEEKKTLSLVCPCPGPLPGKFLILGAIQWVEL